MSLCRVLVCPMYTPRLPTERASARGLLWPTPRLALCRCAPCSALKAGSHGMRWTGTLGARGPQLQRRRDGGEQHGPAKAPCGEGTSPRGRAWLRDVCVEDPTRRCPRQPRWRRMVGLRSAVHRPADTLRPSGPPRPDPRRDTHRPAVRTARVRRRSAARTRYRRSTLAAGRRTRRVP